MANYINRDAVLVQIWKCESITQEQEDELVKAIESIPPADVRPVKRGKWIDDRTEIICDACGERCNDEIMFMLKSVDYPDFCPNCGADMRTIGQRLSDISAEEDLFPELNAEEKAENKAEAKRMIGGSDG